MSLLHTVRFRAASPRHGKCKQACFAHFCPSFYPISVLLHLLRPFTTSPSSCLLSVLLPLLRPFASSLFSCPLSVLSLSSCPLPVLLSSLRPLALSILPDKLFTVFCGLCLLRRECQARHHVHDNTVTRTIVKAFTNLTGCKGRKLINKIDRLHKNMNPLYIHSFVYISILGIYQ